MVEGSGRPLDRVLLSCAGFTDCGHFGKACCCAGCSSDLDPRNVFVHPVVRSRPKFN